MRALVLFALYLSQRDIPPSFRSFSNLFPLYKVPALVPARYMLLVIAISHLIILFNFLCLRGKGIVFLPFFHNAQVLFFYVASSLSNKNIAQKNVPLFFYPLPLCPFSFLTNIYSFPLVKSWRWGVFRGTQAKGVPRVEGRTEKEKARGRKEQREQLHCINRGNKHDSSNYFRGPFTSRGVQY